MVLNLIFSALSLYFFVFFYYFSFNENVLLVLFLAIFLYVIQQGIFSLITDLLDTGSLELYAGYKSQAGTAIVRLADTRSRLLLFRRTADNVLASFSNFLDFQLTFVSFLEQFNHLFYEYVFYSELAGAIAFQNVFVRSNTLKLIDAELATAEFEA